MCVCVFFPGLVCSLLFGFLSSFLLGYVFFVGSQWGIRVIFPVDRLLWGVQIEILVLVLKKESKRFVGAIWWQPSAQSQRTAVESRINHQNLKQSCAF